jgi:hypothetical protein
MTFLFRTAKSIRETWPTGEYLVCDGYRFVYCPVPKVACSSIKRWLLALHGMSGEGHALHDVAAGRFSLRVHQRPKRALRRYFTFAFVRNPWSRLVSAFVNKFVVPKPPLLEAVKRLLANLGAAPEQGISFHQFVAYLQKSDFPNENVHWRPQTLFLPKGLHYLGKFERLPGDFDAVQARLGTRVPLFHLNKSDCSRSFATPCATLTCQELRSLGTLPHYAAFYTDELIEAVGKLYAEDVRRFEYDPPVLVPACGASPGRAPTPSVAGCPGEIRRGDAA